LAYNIDLSDQTGKSYDFGGSNDYSNNDYSNNDNDDKKTSNSDSWKSKDSVFTRDNDNDNDSNKSYNIDLSDRTGNNYLDKSSNNNNNNNKKTNIMKDYTNAGFDPSTTKSKEELQEIINQRYPSSDKTDNYGLNSKNVNDEEVMKSDGYSFTDSYDYIDYQQAKEDHRFNADDIKQITEKQRFSQSPQDIQMKRSNYYQSEIDNIRNYASNLEQQGKTNAVKQGFFGGLMSGFKGFLTTGNVAHLSGGFVSGFANAGVNLFTQPEYNENYKKIQNKTLDDRFPGMSVQDWADIPEGVTTVNYNSDSSSSSINTRSTGSSEGFTNSADFNNQKSETETENVRTSNNNELTDLITWFALNDSQKNKSSSTGSGSSGSSGGTTNIITASGEKKEERSIKDYMPVITGLAVIFGLMFVGGEN
jgi:hypothetical protein